MWIHFCHPSQPACCAAETRTGAGPGARAGQGRLGRTIDLHAHVLTPEVERLIANSPGHHAQVAQMQQDMGAASIAHNQRVMLPQAFPKLTQLTQRLADMDAMGIDLQVLSPTPNQYCYWAEPALAQTIVQLQNEHIARQVATHPDRLLGLGTVALQHPELAVRQLRHAVQNLGLKGVEISTAVNGIDLDAPQFSAFWAEAAALGALVFIHPFGTTLGARTDRHYLNNLIGQPLETTLALSHLIFGGVLDQHPGLKLLAAHGGGYLPAYVGRSNHGHSQRPEARTHAQRAPIDYLRQIWFDSLVYEPAALRQLIDTVGLSQVVLGTDYPYDMGHYDVAALVHAVPGLDDTQRARLLGGNAAALLGLT